jgi:hypothetical protein
MAQCSGSASKSCDHPRVRWHSVQTALRALKPITKGRRPKPTPDRRTTMISWSEDTTSEGAHLVAGAGCINRFGQFSRSGSFRPRLGVVKSIIGHVGASSTCGKRA